MTTKRIIEVRGGDIQQELPLEGFSGKPMNDFLQVKEDYRSGAEQFHIVRIYDLRAEIMIELKGMNEDDVDVLKGIASN